MLKKFFNKKSPPILGRSIQSDIDAHYFFGKTLGTGAFGTVKSATRKSDSLQVAIKMIEKDKIKGREDMVNDEIAVLSKMKHPGVIGLIEKYESKNCIYLVTDLATGGELFDQIIAKGSYTEADAGLLVRQLLEALDYMHGQSIVHRDLKPENMLFSDRTQNARLLITDFGLAKILGESEILSGSCGTLTYVAPEVLRHSGHSYPVDMWAMGVITYILLCGYTPFVGDTDAIIMSAIVNLDYEFDVEYWSQISESAKDFIQKLLTIDPRSRMTAKQALEHVWINEDAKKAVTDLLPKVRENFNARRTFKKAVRAALVSNRLKQLSAQTSGDLATEDLARSEQTTIDDTQSTVPVRSRELFASTSPNSDAPPTLLSANFPPLLQSTPFLVCAFLFVIALGVSMYLG